MADADRTATHALALLRGLQEKPYDFGFYQAVRRLENLYRDKPRVGTSNHASDDPVRLAQEPSTAFAPSTLASFAPGAGNARPRLASYFFGLLGPNGPLPIHLTEYGRERLRNAGDATFVRFLDLFHHRMLSLFYRAWAINQPAVSFDRPEDDRFAVYVGSLFGLGTPALRNRDAFPDLARLRYAALFANQTRHGAGLRAMLKDFFRMPVTIQEFIPGWLHLGEDMRWRLGRSRASGTLGQSATIGARVWSCHHKFRIAFGPLSLAQYRRLLPGGESLRRLVPLVRSYVGDELEWDVNLVLRSEEVPPLELGKGGRLGWTTWLTAPLRSRDAGDLRLNPLGAGG
jgi:type VI secretion system protein ImpH